MAEDRRTTSGEDSGELDIERPGALEGYLRGTGRVGKEERVEVRVLAGGVSNRTVLVKRESGEAWVVKQALAKLRVAAEWFSDVRRIEREAEGLRYLPRIAPEGTITPLVFEDRERHLLAMEAVPEPHENWKGMLLRGEVREDHVRQFGTLLGAIHRGAQGESELFERVFRDRSFFESLRVEPYYQYTGKCVGGVAERFLEDLVRATRRRVLTLTHGDFSPKNILVHEGRLVLLDHEVIHFGDPAFDVGFGMTHLLSKAHHLREHRERFREAAVGFWRSYRAALGAGRLASEPEEYAVRHTLGCLLARVAGKSPLEYLGAEERERQKSIVVELMASPPDSVEELIQGFVGRL